MNPLPMSAAHGEEHRSHDETMRGVAPTKTVGEDAPTARPSLLGDYAALFKARVTLMVVLTAWAGFFLAARKSGAEAFNAHMWWSLLWAMLGIGLVSAGAAGLNEVWEIATDARMARTRNRPLPSGRMSRGAALMLSLGATACGSAMLAAGANLRTMGLALITAASYVFVYTPLKRRSPISTFVGAIPGAMPPVLGWVAVRNHLEWEAFALFAIVFFWQFPHFLAIAWLYREDYERANIRMLPVVEPSGRGTLVQILLTGTALIPVTLLPVVLHMSGGAYLVGALVLGLGYLWFGVRLAAQRLPATAAHSKKYARHLLKASVIYLPLLVALMMLNGAHA